VGAWGAAEETYLTAESLADDVAWRLDAATPTHRAGWEKERASQGNATAHEPQVCESQASAETINARKGNDCLACNSDSPPSLPPSPVG
jgi:hypothetical protein